MLNVDPCTSEVSIEMSNRTSKVVPLKNVNELNEHRLSSLAISVTSKHRIESIEFPWSCYSTDIAIRKESNTLLSVVSSFVPELINKVSHSILCLFGLDLFRARTGRPGVF